MVVAVPTEVDDCRTVPKLKFPLDVKNPEALDCVLFWANGSNSRSSSGPKSMRELSTGWLVCPGVSVVEGLLFPWQQNNNIKLHVHLDS